jgi:hypothetical protein
VLWGEPIGLLPVGNNLFNIYFAHLPLAGFDASRGKLVGLSNPGWPKSSAFASGQACPEAKNKNLPDEGKVSDMCPSVQKGKQPRSRPAT